MQQRSSPIQPMPENWQTALVIAASSAASWRTAQGKQVVYLMVSRGETGIYAMPPSDVNGAGNGSGKLSSCPSAPEFLS